MGKRKSNDFIVNFIKAICPEAPELYMASFNEEKCLADATELIMKLQADNAALRERLARLVEAAKMAIPCLKDWIQSTGFGSINKRDKAALVAIEQAIDSAALSGNTVELKSLQAAAENIIFKRKQNATLTDADFEWLERAVNGENHADQV